jgi:hypothetical protein
MKTFTKMAAQGDFIIIRIDALPHEDALTAVPPEQGTHVIAHSETGHNHVMDARSTRAFTPKKPDIYTLFLQVDEPTDIVHHRAWDTHDTLRVAPGSYMIKRQREYTPEGFRKAQD